MDVGYALVDIGLRLFWCFLVFLLTCSLEDYGRSVSSSVIFYVGPVGGSGFVFPIILVVVSVLDRCSAVWRFGAGGLVVVLVVVLVNCFLLS